LDRRDGQTFLLHGVTGSGKTELYLRAIEHMRRQGRGAIALVPEIALVPQTVRRFMARFPDRVALVHSELSPGQQYDTWRRARAGLIDVVIGARSALFTPLPDIGVIILDEEHDSSYKQSPPIPPPYYHARDVAMQMGRIYGATVILGSATPDLSTAWQARRGQIGTVRLPDRILVHRARLEQQTAQFAIPVERYLPADASEAFGAALPPVSVVDMRSELKAGNRSIFSRALRVALNETLAHGEQAILYLNRRGTATFVLCRDCGYIAKCPRCDSPLTYHESETQLICHTCNFRQEPPTLCPECASKRIRYFGAGTAMIEEAVGAEFPQARLLRWDRDTTRERGAHESILERFSSGEANVLIGTQMIAKGLDIPRVTLVGVLSADTALGLPDYRAGERAFQLLTQVAGRAGRSWLGGRVIIQSYEPGHYAVQAAARHDYEGFYAKEIDYRAQLGYPPFKRLARLLWTYPSEDKARREAERAAAALRTVIERDQLTATRLIGPAPAFFARIKDQYRWQLLLKSPDPRPALRDLRIVPGMTVDIDPLDIL
jgi:primosomal protein N' (replication factor Y)